MGWGHLGDAVGKEVHDGTEQQEGLCRSAQSDDEEDKVAGCCTTPHEAHDGAKPQELRLIAQLRGEEDEQGAQTITGSARMDIAGSTGAHRLRYQCQTKRAASLLFFIIGQSVYALSQRVTSATLHF